VLAVHFFGDAKQCGGCRALEPSMLPSARLAACPNPNAPGSLKGTHCWTLEEEFGTCELSRRHAGGASDALTGYYALALRLQPMPSLLTQQQEKQQQQQRLEVETIRNVPGYCP